MSAAGAEVQKEDLVVGTGAGLRPEDNVHVHYTLTLGGFDSEQVIDSSRSRGRPFQFRYDTGAVIKGWDLGIAGMKEGGRRRLVIPSELGYGTRGAGKSRVHLRAVQ
ncbi:unnamed protein product [Agarophyton chilense]